jgi:predicted heme/steroid binding protein
MTIKNRSKHQHWVPQFYLRCFSTAETRGSDQPRVWIFSKDDADGNETLTSVRNVCGKRYLYSPIQPDGERNWELDERLDSLESLLGRIWRDVAIDFVSLDDPAIRKGLALFTAVMYLRNPEIRTQVERAHRRLVEFFESITCRADGTPDIQEVELNGQVYEVSTDGWQDFRSWGKNDHDRFFAQTVKSEAAKIAEMLMQKRWSIVCTDHEAFITTDKPVCMMHESQEKFGFGTSGTIVIFPLSPQRLLVMDDMHNEPANQYYPIKEFEAAAYNLMTWRGSGRFLITGRSIPEVLEEILSLEKLT